MPSQEIILYSAVDPLKALVKIAEKVFQSHQNAVIRTSCREKSLMIDQLLWTYTPLSFLPHGCEGQDDVPADHPLWITWTLSNPNHSSTLICLEGLGPSEGDQEFDKIILVMGPHDTCPLLEGGPSCTFWQQTSSGWQKIPSFDLFQKAHQAGSIQKGDGNT